ncbi:MAG: PAS domain-containing protein [Betaproteobacteria bacterium]|nr:PAS domain-containing protein [Betaproteobacteria bacterium]
MQARAEQINTELEARIQARTRELQENERKYQRIIDVTREGFWLVDGWSRTSSVAGIAFVRNRNFVWVNRAFEQDMLGYEAGELAGKSSLITYPSPEMYAGLGPQIDNILIEKGMFQIP